jgi:hypothetical protein
MFCNGLGFIVCSLRAELTVLVDMQYMFYMYICIYDV